ncbi:hypothetical protein ADIARSV_3443 [Arcticibacter svalbardensis MN12-7]|uniref:Uncharacterized protein n=1 Tax=Arcticibacter svalbardensis MN12-7 TaxID=1150600 RepID=R9GWN2_9SPHI|nr:hypothetical protein ADIARSV_3443 [Arcticibacter svalbardensis MN12-7]
MGSVTVFFFLSVVYSRINVLKLMELTVSVNWDDLIVGNENFPF